MEAGGPQGLVGVDVADAGEEGLVEQKGFEGTGAGGKAPGEIGGRDFQRFGAEAFQRAGGVPGQADAAEFAGI